MHQYMLWATHLESSLAERALGVLVDKWKIVARRSEMVILPFCLPLVEPHVECCAHFWAPLYKKKHGHTGDITAKGHECV